MSVNACESVEEMGRRMLGVGGSVQLLSSLSAVHGLVIFQRDIDPGLFFLLNLIPAATGLWTQTKRRNQGLQDGSSSGETMTCCVKED